MSSMKHTNICSKLICALLCAVMILPLSGCGETRLNQKEVYAMHSGGYKRGENKRNKAEYPTLQADKDGKQSRAYKSEDK